MNKFKIIFTLCFLFNNVFAALLSPSNGTTLNYTHVLFEWEQEFNASSYTLYLDTNSNFSNPIEISDNSLIYIDTENIDWGSTYYWKVKPEYSNGTSGDWSETYSFSTGSTLSTAYSINTDDNSYQPGVTLFSSFFNYFSAMIDQDGNEIWNTGNNEIIYYNTDFYGQIFGCYVNNNIANYLPGIEFSINGNYLWEEPNDDFLHHELIQLPDGNYLGLIETIELGPIPEGSWTGLFSGSGYEADGITNEFPWVGDKIVIWDKDTKNIIWEWDTFDYFSMEDFDFLSDSWIEGYTNGRYDWTHANALVPEFNDQGELEYIYISCRHLSRITKIDYNTKDIVWNMGFPGLSGDVNCGLDLKFSFQHSLQLTDEGNIVTLDNGNLSQLLGADYPTTRGLEIAINETNNSCDANIVWEYSLPEEYFGFASGNVQKLDNGNYLIVTVGDGGTALEVDLNNNHIWEGKLNLQFPNGAVYRANRVPGLYPVAFSTIIESMYTDSGTNYIDTIVDQENLTLKLFNEGSSIEEYNILLSYNSEEYNSIFNDNLSVDESTEVQFPHQDASIINIKIIPKHRLDLEKIITIYLNGCNDIVDCLGVCGGDATQDCLGECDGNAIIDCNGDCNGNAVEDCSGICEGSSIVDCEGVCGGNASLDVCGICNGNSTLPCNECGDGYTLYTDIPNSTIVLDGSECFNNIDLLALSDIISANSLSSIESPIHLGTQNWSSGRITRLEAGNYFQGGSVNLTTIPESIQDMSQMSVLYLDKNSLTQLPDAITNLNNLFYLVLPFNQLTSIPENIGNLSSLFWLDVGYNELNSLPESIGNLQNLVYLWMFNNNLTELPDSFCDLNINWDSDDYGFLPYFGAGANQLCENVPDCIASSSNLNSSVDPLYYSFEITLEQECEEECVPADLNNDGISNVVDIVAIVNIVLDQSTPTDAQLCVADLNSDGIVNVVDIVALVNIVLG